MVWGLASITQEERLRWVFYSLKKRTINRDVIAIFG